MHISFFYTRQTLVALHAAQMAIMIVCLFGEIFVFSN